MLPPRLPPPAATPGAPSTYSPGVYVADRPVPSAAEAAAVAAAGAADYNPLTATGGSLTRGSPGQGGNSPGTGRAGTLQPVDYSYPELGHSQILGATQSSQPSTKSHVYDVYGQPRAVPPQLPRQHRTDEADVALNEAYLRAEADAVRIGKTASTSLIRHAGKALKQFTLTPGHLHLGSVPVGSVAHRTARLANVSTAAARFTVSRPELPLRVIYKPGPVAAGMEAVVTVEFVAEKPGDFVGEVVVKSELNVLTLTVSAKVVPASPDDGCVTGDVAGPASPPPPSAGPSPSSRGSPAKRQGESPGGLPPVTSARRSASQTSRLASPLAGASRGGSPPAVPGVGTLELPQLDETKTLDQLLAGAQGGAAGGTEGEGEQ